MEQLCRRCSLGTPINPSERIFGGLIHRMYRVRTQSGEYAVKLLSRDALAEPGSRDRILLGERIAAAVAESGLPAVAALNIGGSVLQETETMTALIYRWVNGRPLPATSAGPRRAGQIGHILGRMHRLPLSFPDPQPPSAIRFSDAEWSRLADAAEAAGVEWAADLRNALPDLSRWSRELTEAQRNLEETWVVSHADLHQQNVLWSDENTPWLIDWEAAGLQQPAKEAVVCALEWSGFVEGEPDLATFRAFLRSYRDEAPLSSGDVSLGLRACYGNWLGWLRFNALRSLGGTDQHEREEGARQVVGTTATVRRVEVSFSALEEVF